MFWKAFVIVLIIVIIFYWRSILTNVGHLIGRTVYVDVALSHNEAEHYTSLIVPHLQPGDIILSNTDYHLSNLFIPGKYTHAACYVGYGTIVNRHFVPSVNGYPVLIESIFKRGVHLVPLADFISDKSRIIALRNDIPPDLIPVFLDQLMKKIGKSFTDLDNDNPDYYCTKLITSSLEKTIGKAEFVKKYGDPWVYLPIHFLRLSTTIKLELKRYDLR